MPFSAGDVRSPSRLGSQREFSPLPQRPARGRWTNGGVPIGQGSMFVSRRSQASSTSKLTSRHCGAALDRYVSLLSRTPLFAAMHTWPVDRRLNLTSGAVAMLDVIDQRSLIRSTPRRSALGPAVRATVESWCFKRCCALRTRQLGARKSGCGPSEIDDVVMALDAAAPITPGRATRRPVVARGAWKSGNSCQTLRSAILIVLAGHETTATTLAVGVRRCIRTRCPALVVAVGKPSRRR